MKQYLKWGAIAGAAGGLTSALFLVLIGERSIRAALAIEAAHAGPGGHDEMFTRTVQLFGGAAAATLYGVCAGVVFAVVFAAVRHRSRLRDEFSRAAGLGAVAFVTIALAPQLKYPANPPAVGNPDTVNQRTIAYLTFVAAMVVLAIAAWRASRWLRARGTGDPVRLPVLAFGTAAVAGVLMALWPANPDRITIPATLLWHFRLASLAGMAILWSVTATVFGWQAGAAARELVHDPASGDVAVRA